MALFEIRHRFTGSVLFSLETESLKLCVQAAVTAKAYLGDANLSCAYLSDADLSCADLSCAYLSDANLSGANLSGADLSCAYLSDANLSGADLSCADLSCANLSGADLSGANLSDANLSGANLSGADLRGADLGGADLGGANLSCANLSGAKGVIHLGTPDGWHAHAWLRDGWLSIRVGCQEKRLAEACKYWAGKEDRREVMAALAYAEAVATLRGWSVTKPAQAVPA